MPNRYIPWFMVLLVAAFVYGLSYRATHRSPSPPGYDFYDSARVTVQIHGSDTDHDIFGRYNHILHGQRVLIKAQQLAPGKYELLFPVYSPRSAMLYVDDEALDIFLNPGDSTLEVSLWYRPEVYAFDSIAYQGELASVCRYYLAKARRFNRTHIRGYRNTLVADDLMTFSARLDTMAAMELGMLAEQQVLGGLPEWFVDFERNDITYQKAYLKLTQAMELDTLPAWLDQPPLDQEAAAFSYYYYLYLHTYLACLPVHVPEDLEDPEARRAYGELLLADSLLSGNPHDVFVTRVMYEVMEPGRLALARRLLRDFGPGLFSRKYYRYLTRRLEEISGLS